MQFSDTCIQVTPFQLNDHFIYTFDRWLAFNELTLLHWVHLHSSIAHWVWRIYDSLIPLLFLAPVTMALLKEQKAVELFFIAMLLAMLIGYPLYYFFPTAGAPTGAIQSPYFTVLQNTVLTQFEQLHHFQTITHTYPGIIGFPSFHVIWAILLVYLFSRKRFVFWLVSCYALLLMFSTLATGWHYLTDVLGGIAVGLLVIYLTEKLYHYRQV